MTHSEAIAQAQNVYRAIHMYVVKFPDGTFGVAEGYKVTSDGRAEVYGKNGRAMEHYFRTQYCGRFDESGTYKFGTD